MNPKTGIIIPKITQGSIPVKLTFMASISTTLVKALENPYVAILWNKINEVVPDFPVPTRITCLRTDNSIDHMFVWTLSRHSLIITITSNIAWRYVDIIANSQVCGTSFEDLIPHLEFIIMASVHDV